MSLINAIPNEILDKIFQLLDSADKSACAAVNKAFYSLTTPELWRFPVIGSRYRLGYFLGSVETSRNRGYMRGINLGRNSYVTDEDLVRIVRSVPHLEDIVIVCARKLTDKSMVALAQYCKRLRSFQLHHCKLFSPLFQPLAQFARLKTVQFVECNIRSSNAPRRPVHIPILQLTLKGCKWVDCGDRTDSIRLLVHLETLSIEDCDCLPGFLHQLSGDTPCLPKLNTFVLSDPHLTDQHILPFLNTHPDLRTIELNCPVTEALLLEMVHPQLKVLKINTSRTITVQAIHRLVNRCTQLSTLQLTYSGFSVADVNENRSIRWNKMDLERIRDI